MHPPGGNAAAGFRQLEGAALLQARPPSDESDVDDPLVTPFRQHYEHCLSLDIERQLHECADHLQHPDVLLMEFFESYHLIERSWSPGRELRPDDEAGELVLEPFYESLELSVRGGKRLQERLVCISGSMSPVPDERHPALSRRGLDYLGMRAGPPPHLVLGVTQASKEETPYVMLLRVLNCFAELSPPLRVVQLGRELIRDRIPENTRFDLHVGITERQSTQAWVSLIELTRDLAELFKRQIGAHDQFSGTLGRIECVEVETCDSDGVVAMRRIWSL